MSCDLENKASPSESGRGLRLSQLPSSLRPSARNLISELDADGDGFLDENELAMVLNTLQSARTQNRSLTKVLGGMVFATLVLTGAVFGTSIAAAHLAKDTSVDSSGVLHDKLTGAVVQTNQAMAWSEGRNLVDLTNSELALLKEMELLDGNLHFAVKGFARLPSEDAEDQQVLLLVEGGTLAYDKTGMTGATGAALTLVQAAYGLSDLDAGVHLEGDDNRNLAYGGYGYPRGDGGQYGMSPGRFSPGYNYSDKRLKKDINYVGRSPLGIPTYTFKYRESTKDAIDGTLDTESIYFGVMAQDLLELNPSAVVKNTINGYYSVDYSKIDVNFHKLV